MSVSVNVRPLSDIAGDALRDATLKGNARAWATPYLSALRSCASVSDSYGADDADSLVRYALSNLQGWRGDSARRVKAELKAHLI